MKKLLWAGAILFSFLIVVLALPLLFAKVCIFDPEGINSLDDARSYYTVVATVSTVFTSVIGLILGYLYFESRKDFDEKILLEQRKRAHAKLVLECLEKYLEQIELILSKKFKSQDELNDLRNELGTIWDHIEAYLDNQPHSGHFTVREVREFVEMVSFVDKNFQVKEESYHSLSTSDTRRSKHQFLNHYKHLRKICIAKLV